MYTSNGLATGRSVRGAWSQALFAVTPRVLMEEEAWGAAWAAEPELDPEGSSALASLCCPHVSPNDRQAVTNGGKLTKDTDDAQKEGTPNGYPCIQGKQRGPVGTCRTGSGSPRPGSLGQVPRVAGVAGVVGVVGVAVV